MKRGFLNTPRYKRVIEEEQNSSPGPKQPRHASDGDGHEHVGTKESLTSGADTEENGKEGGSPKGKGKEKAVGVESFDPTTCPDSTMEKFEVQRFPPRRRGWGRHPGEEHLHTVPHSHGDMNKKRAMFCFWPRRPGGRPIVRSDSNWQPKGKLSPDGYPWGATLFDLYGVNRVPGLKNAISYTTGSALLEEMKAMNEMDVAVSQIEWASTEGEPRDEGAADTAELIRCQDTRVRLMGSMNLRFFGLNLLEVDPEEKDGEKLSEENGRDKEDSNDEEHDYSSVDDEDTDQAPIPHPSAMPAVTSPFHSSHYPKPWPLVPFKDPVSILLQERIPLYLLPYTLYVHDPFNLLHVRERLFRNMSWNSRPDIVRTYNLKLSNPVQKDCKEAREKAEALEEFKARTLIVLRYKRTPEQIRNYEPMIEVPLPPYPRRKMKTDEAHLYLSPIAKIGEGHHSVVYKGEWELPRDIFGRPELCPECFKESADKEIQRLKDTGRWANLLKAASWGPRSFTGGRRTVVQLEAASDPVNLQRDREIIEREIICVVPPNAPPSQVLESLDEKNIWGIFMEKEDKNAVVLDFTKTLGSNEESYVTTIRIDPPFSCESEKTCTHVAFLKPRTAMFTVIAKLSLEDDPHLVREARNYQEFPEHFFCHYNGYTIISQLRAVVPVHAVVPQFYGYYTPQMEKRGGERERYLSPILLLEHCGKPIEPETLSLEDQEECASLVLRFQKAGWLHESIAPRNFLVQKGKPTEFPLMREAHPELSFRLIDFGRSRKYDRAKDKSGEEAETLRVFQKLYGQMARTLC